MKFLKWLLPLVVTCVFSTTSFSQINQNDSLAIINLRNDLGLSAVSGLSSNDPALWNQAYIDTLYDPATTSFRITAINFNGLVATPAATITVLPESIITDTELNWVESISLNN
ncbi:MAG: hypothetical protein JKY03_02920, partial [Aureispira sp.]|nr:hypothetical protein [Aureispira sp.]